VRRLAPTAALIAAAFLAAGCGSDDDETTGGTTAASGGEAVELTAAEYAFDPSNLSLDAAGKVTFTVSNDGEETHALEVEGNGVEEETESIGPGESGTLTVELEPGEYEFYCPIDGHKDEGMEGTLVVGGSSAGAGTSTGQSDTTDTTESGSYGG
jgi:uncharacterized cupredoxin-like copper-binding protein